MRIITVDIDGEPRIYLPTPTRLNRVARRVYQVFLALVALAAVGAVVHNPSPLVCYGAILLLVPLPAYWVIERRIKTFKVEKWEVANKAYRSTLLGAEVGVPMIVLPMLPAFPAMLQAYGFYLSQESLALIVTWFALALTFTSIPANYTWARSILGLER